jgi:serine/threonine-protein kinase
VALDLGSAVVRWPQLLDDGDTVIYTAFGADGADRASIEAQSLRNGERRVLIRGGTFGRYQSDGYLAYVNQGTLYAVKVDPATLAVAGTPIPVFDDVAYSPLFGYAQFDLSRNGMLIYRRGAENQRTVVSWLSGGRPVLPAGRYSWIRVAPDGRRAAVTTQESGVAAISIYDLATQERAGTTAQPGQYTGLTWLSHDVIVFGGSDGLGWIRVDKPDEMAPLLASRNAQTPWSVSPDGRLAYYERSAETGFDLWTVPIEWTNGRPKAGQPEPFLRTRAFEVYPSFSPDGRWIAYASNESGPWEVYVRRFPDDGTKVRVSSSGGVVPAWSANGELVFRTSAQQLMIAPYKTGRGSIIIEPAKPLSQELLADTGVLPNFDVGVDGRTMVLKSAAVTDQQSPNHVTLVTNFGSEVRRRVQTR